ncbi:MAG: type II toxin-antitoxin system RelE/ParE family toxin [Isosphaeraceae bacterium]
MEVEFADPDLDRLETDPKFNAGFPREIVRAYRKLMQVIRNAPDERVFYGMKALRFEKLKGPRDHQRSMRLNNQWRLIIELRPSSPKNVVVLIAIEDYH